MELHELPDDSVLAQDLGHRQHQVRGCGSRRQLAVQAESDHHRQRLVQRLAEQRRLGLDTSDSPAHHTESVDHGRMRVGPHQGVGERNQLARLVRSGADHIGQELQVDLVHDARAGRHDPEIPECLLRPAKERVALTVALVLALHVDQERGLGPVLIDLDGVVDHQIGGDERIDACRVTAHLGHRVAHGGQVDHARDAGEVLEDDAGGHERQLVLARVGRIPRRQGADVVRVHESSARCGVAQGVLEQDLDREREPRQIGHAGRLEAVIGVGLATDAQLRARGGGVDHG